MIAPEDDFDRLSVRNPKRLPAQDHNSAIQLALPRFAASGTIDNNLNPQSWLTVMVFQEEGVRAIGILPNLLPSDTPDRNNVSFVNTLRHCCTLPSRNEVHLAAN